jgi:dihydroorotase
MGGATLMNRRQALKHVLAGAAFAAVPADSLLAADYDLLVRGGRVIDPSQKIDRLADVAIRDGRIDTVRPDIPAASASTVIDARGRLVVPGLIDIHLHARDAALPPSEILSTGVTTMVDAGSKGADNVDQIVAIARAAPNRLRLLLNIARLGNDPVNGEFTGGLEAGDVTSARRAAEAHRDWVIGMKARLSRGVTGNRDLDVLKLALQVAAPLKLPLMLHIGDTFTPLPQILALLRPGDIVTHAYVPSVGILDANGRVLPEVREARGRGIRFDFANGLTEHWAWDVAERALAQDFLPDTISSDLTVAGRKAQVIDLPNVLSKFLLLGMPLADVLARVTSNAARTFRQLDGLGTLRDGATADLAVLEMTEGRFEFVDNYKQTRQGRQRLVTRAVVFGGKPFATEAAGARLLG